MKPRNNTINMMMHYEFISAIRNPFISKNKRYRTIVSMGELSRKK